MNQPINQRLYAASKGTPVCMSSPTDFYFLISRVCALNGISKPSEEATALLHGFITDHYMWATCEDIELATAMNAASQLGDKSIPYGELSASFIGDLLNAYTPIRGKAVLHYRQLEERVDTSHQLAPVAMSDDMWREMMMKDKEWLKAGKDTWRIGAVRMVRYLDERGIINDNTFTDEEWKQFNTRAKINTMEKRRIGPGAVSRMESHERARFDQECLDEKKTLVYRDWLIRKMQ